MKTLLAVTKWSVPVMMIGLGAFGPSVSHAGMVQDDLQVATIGYDKACAEGDGSCGPAPQMVCGLNGKNYSEKMYIAPQ
ncbi:hypothetical protein [Gemmatimonas sp.]|uniref:hypothetical protein n=1 Tax=Gemmatimonas sp. TaxID=1962908 RepID=UPI003F6FB014